MDKIEKIRAEIERLKGQLIRGACAAQIEMETNCKDEAYNEVLAFLDTLEEEPVGEELEKEIEKTWLEYECYNEDYDKVAEMRWNEFENVARHFYELGKNSK